MTPHIRKLVFYALFFLSLAASPLFSLEQTRALWVSRWDYSSERDIKKIVANASRLNFNVILFQVRGAGTSLYASQLEPRSGLLSDADEDWDPLLSAITLAHEAGLQLHAWVNVYPAWSGDIPPTDTTQLFYQHPSWFMYDVYGRHSQLTNGYQWLSPTHPEVAPYLLKICAEIYENYDIDGLHLDYIRFPAASYSYDPASVRLFRQKFGATPQQRPRTWMRFRQNSISAFLDSLYAAIKFYNPKLVVSAAVISNYDLGKKIYFQDSHGWLARGSVDAIYPMLYTDDAKIFKRRLNDFLQNSHNRHVYPGINLDYDDVDGKFDIIRELGASGMGVFSYSELTNEHSIKPEIASLLAPLWSEKAQPADMPWKSYLKDNQGPVISQVQSVPSPLQAGVDFQIAARITDPSGVYDDETGLSGQGVVLLYGATWPPRDSLTITMHRIKKTKRWFITDDELQGPKPGAVFYGRITAYDDFYESVNNPRRNVGLSEVFRLPVLRPDTAFVYQGEIGPILWRPGDVEVDDIGHIWATTEKGGPVVVMNSAGDPLSFSPLKKGINGYFEQIWMDKVIGFARGPFATMLVACNSNPPMIFRFDIESGDALPGIELSFKIGAIAADGAGDIYVLQRKTMQWYALSPTGIELHNSPFGGQGAGADIAVLSNGARVFIADRSANVVQAWNGAVEGAWSQYWRVGDLTSPDMGMGKMAVDKNDHIYICSSRFGIISIFHRAGRLLGHIIDRENLIAPIAVALSPDGQYLYHIEAVGNGPTKVRKWRR